jgi:hypothetical protein
MARAKKAPVARKRAPRRRSESGALRAVTDELGITTPKASKRRKRQ